MDVSTKAMKSIFPNATKEPFSIRSYKNLLTFISDPQTKGIAQSNASVEWLGIFDLPVTL